MGKISEKVGFVGGGAMAQVQYIILMHNAYNPHNYIL